jgi:N-acetylglucosaminyldiphosphoundecaprenol N-acetyl-beta-D-mannosaminyltransferase
MDHTMSSLFAGNTTSSSAQSVNILGIGLSVVNMEDALDRTESLIERRGKGYLCVTGVHGIMEAQSSPELQLILNDSFLTVPDGMPTVWIGRLYGHRSMSRVYGPDFMLALCDRSQKKEYRHFLYGGSKGVAEELRQRLTARFPQLQIVGTYTPPFRPLTAEESAELRSQVAATRPDIIWVGLSTPKQERFMHATLALLDTHVMVGVGAAFDIHTGRIQDAPGWMKQAGLQWLHRLIQEPRRLGRRYLINNPIFVTKVSWQLINDLCLGRLRLKL